MKTVRESAVMKAVLWIGHMGLWVSFTFFDAHFSKRNRFYFERLASKARFVKRWNDVVDSVRGILLLLWRKRVRVAQRVREIWGAQVAVVNEKPCPLKVIHLHLSIYYY